MRPLADLSNPIDHAMGVESNAVSQLNLVADCAVWSDVAIATNACARTNDGSGVNGGWVSGC